MKSNSATRSSSRCASDSFDFLSMLVEVLGAELYLFCFVLFFVPARVTGDLYIPSDRRRGFSRLCESRQSSKAAVLLIKNKIWREHDPSMVFLIQVLTLSCLFYLFIYLFIYLFLFCHVLVSAFQSLPPLAYSVRLPFFFLFLLYSFFILVNPAYFISFFFFIFFWLFRFVLGCTQVGTVYIYKKERLFCSVSSSQFSARLTGGNNGSLV